jgi:hypothetical protein
VKETRSGLTEAQIALLHQRALEGESVKALAAEVGVHTSSLSRLLGRRFGFVPAAGRLEEATIKLPSDPLETGYIAGLVDAAGYISRASKYGGWSVKVLMTDPGPV